MEDKRLADDNRYLFDQEKYSYNYLRNLLFIVGEVRQAIDRITQALPTGVYREATSEWSLICMKMCQEIGEVLTKRTNDRLGKEL